jgi:uncharacterized membrane protein
MEKPSNAELIRMILDDEASALEEEELLNLLMQQRLSRNVNIEHRMRQTMGDRMADRIAQFAGSWKFIGIFMGVLLLWIVINSVALLAKPFDPYPFILMNLILSCVAAIQAPVIMMSQNRQEKKDRLRAEHDYEVNLKAEILIEDIIKRLEKIEQNQAQLAERLLGSGTGPSGG